MSTFLGVPIIRIIVFGVYAGVPYLGKLPHVDISKSGGAPDILPFTSNTVLVIIRTPTKDF